MLTKILSVQMLHHICSNSSNSSVLSSVWASLAWVTQLSQSKSKAIADKQVRAHVTQSRCTITLLNNKCFLISCSSKSLMNPMKTVEQEWRIKLVRKVTYRTFSLQTTYRSRKWHQVYWKSLVTTKKDYRSGACEELFKYKECWQSSILV